MPVDTTLVHPFAADHMTIRTAQRIAARWQSRYARMPHPYTGEYYQQACKELALAYMLMATRGRCNRSWQTRYMRTASRWMVRAENLSASVKVTNW